MSAEQPSSEESGTATRPVEFLYLDRARLVSYASQIDDGLTLLRRQAESSHAGKQAKSASREVATSKSVATESGAEGNIHFLKALLRRRRETGEVKTERSPDTSAFDTAATLIDVSKVEHDNLMLLVERGLEAKGILRDFDGSTEGGGLYRFTGPLTFFDWEIVTAALNQWQGIADLSGLSKKLSGQKSIDTDALPPKTAASISSVLQMFSLNEMQVSMTSAGKSITGPLAPLNLQMTREQLKLAYAMSDSAIDAIMIAFVPPKSKAAHKKQGFAQHMKFDSMMTSFVGHVDISVLPISIHIPL